MGLGLAPFHFLWLAFPAICVAIFQAVTAAGAGQSARRGFGIGFGYALISLFWIVEPFLVDLARHGWMAPFALTAMASGFGAFWGLGFWAAGRFTPENSLARMIAIPVLWTASELLRSYVFTGFPWGLVSYVWIDTPIYQITAIIGPHGLTLMTLGLASMLIFGIRNRSALVLVLAVVAFGLSFLWGFRAMVPVSPTGDDPLVVRLIQPNAGQQEKWDPQMMPLFYDRQISLTSETANPAPDLVVWPEVAVPFLLNDPSQPFWEIAGAAGDATVILGAQRLDGPRAFNSLAVLANDGEVRQIYDKQHLVPFGEYLPGGVFLARFGLKSLTARYGFGYSAGQGPKVMDLGDLGKVLPLICYEGIFPHEVRATATRPDWMLMITNDAWFGTLSGPFQHLDQARARSIETGLPMVRVANTGVSAVIDAHGRIMGAIPQGVAGRLDLALPGARPATPYWKTGDVPVLLSLILMLFTAVWLGRSNGIDPVTPDV